MDGYKQDPVAIVGLACRLPGSCNTPKEFWDFLERGGIASLIPPETRFRLDTHQDGSKKPGTMASPGGMFIDADPRDIDAPFFKLSKGEAVSMDPQQRQLLEVVYEGLENSGITLEELNSNPVGCFVSSYACDYADIQARDPENRAPATTVGIGRAMLSNRISHFLNIKGPSMTIDTACSGSLVGADIAIRYLQTREITGAIVAGCNMYLSPEHVMDSMSANGTASATGRCHTFDGKADGYIKSEAVNMVFLKRLDDAIRDKNPIRAIIRGSATGSDGWTAGIASPNWEAQAATIQQAYRNAHISDLSKTSYVECHGTGTRAGDVIEVNGVASVFSPFRTAELPLQIGSVKSNIGHSEPAAGISGLLKATLALEAGIIPGNPTFKDPNPKIEFEKIKLRPSRVSTRWCVPPRLRRAGVNSFGYGGSNAHLIVDCALEESLHISSFMKEEEDIFADDESTSDNRPYLLVLSANDERSLRDYTTALDRHLTNPLVKVGFRDLAYTLSEKRSRHFYRGFLMARNGRLDVASLITGKEAQPPPRIGLVFTGQGAQWPCMGKDLIENFPIARSRLAYLDGVLRSLPDCPEWSVLEELSIARTPEYYRQPELSQTLVTALQLALLAVLDHCGVSYEAVVGHSSGEIAGAVAAGYITPEDAIKIAYYRGVATSALKNDGSLGMMAVGLREDQARDYLSTQEGTLQIACVNSPSSVTLSGKRAELISLEQQIKKDGHFARLLAVDAAYHSQYMTEVAVHYRALMEQNCEWDAPSPRETDMYSSVTGERAGDEVRKACYWTSNMVQPVLFNSAVQELQKTRSEVLLIEIGPSGALSGPLKQIKQAAGSRAGYLSAWKRGSDASNALFNTIGNLFIRGIPVNLPRFNEDESPQPPRTIVDLPNYCWNHSIKYWYESQASKDWRFRKFLRHDLLGSKILGTPWTQPTWQRTLRLQDVSWLRDHKLGESVVFPAAGYVSMAIEAMFQMGKATGRVLDETNVAQLTYQLRNVEFLKAMMLEDGGAEHNLILTLNPQHGSNETWYEFNVSLIVDDIMSTHSKGLIRITTVDPIDASSEDIQPLQYSTPAHVWYKTMHDVGYSFGPSFQKQLSVESIAGSRRSRSLVSLEWPESSFKQSNYSLHPAVIDGCFQTSSASLWEGHRSSIDAVLVPRMIDSLIITSQSSSNKTGMAVSSSKFTGPGRENDPTSYASDVLVFNAETSKSIFSMQGLRFSSLERKETASDAHVYNRLTWKPDFSFSTQTELEHMLMGDIDCTNSRTTLIQKINKLLDLIAFRKPEAKVLEIHAGEKSDSIWIDGRDVTSFDRTSSCRLHIHGLSQEVLREATSKYGSSIGNVALTWSESFQSWNLEEEFDVVILHSSISPMTISKAIAKAREALKHGGIFLLLKDPTQQQDEDGSLDLMPCILQSVSKGFQHPLSLRRLPPIVAEQSEVTEYVFGIAQDSQGQSDTIDKFVSIARFSETQVCDERLTTLLTKSGWRLSSHRLPFDTISSDSTVVVFEEVFIPFLSSIADEEWSALQSLVRQGCRILWVTSGSQMAVTNPERSLIHGLARSICNEDPSSVFMTLDVEGTDIQNTAKAIDLVLQRLKSVDTSVDTDTEFVERQGNMHIGRVVLDDKVNTQDKADRSGAESQPQDLFAQNHCVRLVSERPGTLDSLKYVSIPDAETTLPEGHVEVDVHATSLNFKDVAIAMGLVPGNEHLLGLEAAGIVRRVGAGVNNIRIGQRVVVNRKGSLANRVQGRVEGEIHPLPDWLSFEAASTLTTVYSTVLYGLLDLANTHCGSSVLVHSAAGGVGLAALQLCKYIGADIYATVGSDEKRRFLMSEYDIPDHRILSSRSVDEFEPELMRLTRGKGVDVVLNSLTGEMLHASWRCIATGGTFVEIGKKDILDRARIDMEPFNRNASYRAVDMSHECIGFPLKARLLTEIFDLLEKGHIKPVHVSKTFGFHDVHAAFRYMRSGTNIGKTVITRGTFDGVVPIRPLSPALQLDPASSYLIVGGLKGLCGSLAVYLARNGASNLTILSRSGYSDEKSLSAIRDLESLGAHIDLIVGDVTQSEAVERAFRSASKPIRGIIQGAMVLRDKMYDSMSASEFRSALDAKVRGTWNLHNTALKFGNPLSFFTMLSSICGLAGQKGQANYSAANVFLDAFATYRNQMQLPACAVDLGVIEDVGYVNEREDLGRRLRAQGWIPIRERLLHEILRFSLLQQGHAPVNRESTAQLITGMPFPLPKDSPAQRDPRFSHLRTSFTGSGGADESGGTGGQSTVELLRRAWKEGGETAEGAHQQAHLLDMLVQLANRKLMRSLGLDEEMDPERPLSSYGIDSLVAVEFRNWTRTELGVETSTLEVVGAKTLRSLAEIIMRRGGGK